ncbi:AraC family transcriptional regulator [Cupriavidus taiwanensis]|uniref:AraC family transcriptional regulator n=1 Tax=Cupriavidus taiwanensis TaxID=164546 RepID=A0A375EDU8_9BURK|nr:AraC family transcriptional regulator [Cupriavidus taiwanensis]SOZ19046.1 AraC family transcriptional regulator [Cupriavidus taiwanensis]SOZ32197.1 AraC family transcriptional regulator [Cupriavidus taiwanensis]SOZ47796.1 AraC family transcriptional regulator [Cupriavidus taiwanensis]SOZ68227.1 AraC family transcriptional regulator [Cupriavidus taiwanensis]SOZ69179.1 AraC family transcriptional regulator [Cupriavidus taiwanensis]
MSLLVRAAALTNYSEVARAAGLDPVRMLFDAGLSPGVLREPDLKIPVERFGRLLQASADISGNESFGLCMAESRLLSNLGAVGMLIRDQATLRDSLDMLMRYQPMLNGAQSLAVEECGELVIIRETLIAGSAHQPTRQRMELALGVMVRLIRQLLRPDWQPQRVCFEHSAPRDLSAHHRFLGPRIEFNCDFNGIICAKADLDARNPWADPAMVRYAQRLIDSSAMSQRTTMREDVRRAVLLLLPSGRCSIEQVAESLGVVCRTVQRRLAEEGQSFSTIVNEVRAELATRHVIESDRPLTEVATMLGFSALSGFSRWYHVQFGCSPRESRIARRPAAPSPASKA